MWFLVWFAAILMCVRALGMGVRGRGRDHIYPASSAIRDNSSYIRIRFVVAPIPIYSTTPYKRRCNPVSLSTQRVDIRYFGGSMCPLQSRYKLKIVTRRRSQSSNAVKQLLRAPTSWGVYFETSSYC